MRFRLSFGLFVATPIACFSDSPGPSSGGSTTGTATDASDATATTATTTITPGTSVDTADTADTTDTADTQGADATTTADDTTTAGETGDACPPDFTCLVDAPRGWSGPFVAAIATGGARASCPASWSDAVTSVHRDLVAPPAECTCECMPPQDACLASVELHIDGACNDLDIAQPSNANGCTQTGGATTVRASASNGVNPSVCTGVVQAEIPDFSWDTSASLCVPTRAMSCNDGSCAPDDAGLHCILREGEHACPEGPYTVAHAYFAGALDQRACSDCTCGLPVNPVCGGPLSQLLVFASGDCSGMSNASLPMNTCGAAAGSARYVPQSLGECNPLALPEPQGDVMPSGAVTLCCTR